VIPWSILMLTRSGSKREIVHYLSSLVPKYSFSRQEACGLSGFQCTSELSNNKILNASNFENNPELRLLLDSLRSIVVYVDRWCTVQHGNTQALRWCSLDSIQGISFIELAGNWDNPFERQREIMQVMRSGRSTWRSLEHSFENGREVWYHVDKIPIRNRHGVINGTLLIIDDVTDNVQQEKALKESEARYRAFVSNSADAIWRYDIKPAIDTRTSLAEQANQILRRAELVECNDKLVSLFQATEAKELLGSPLYLNSAIVNKHDIREFVENGYRLESIEFAGVNKKGERILLETSAVGVVEKGFLVRFWGTSRDITEQKRYLDRMEYLANHDSLTSLPNRVLLYRRIEEALSKRQSHQMYALLLIDLDRFKEINDTLGHLAGDKVLRQLGPRFQAELGELPGVIARLGGDEFAIFLTNIRSAEEAVEMGQRFLGAICQVFEIDGFRTEIGASIGVAIAPDQARDVTTLMRYADIAMYHAKTRLKGVSIYDPDIDSHSPVRLELMGALGRAIRENQMRLHFQPKVRVCDNQVYGFESLLRWEHPDLGFVPPGEFMPIAETSNVIYPLTVWVLEETVKQCAQWVQLGYKISVAMNLSARNLLDDRIVSELRRVLREYQLSGEHLEMEITESMIMSDPQRSELALERISALGVKLSVDDFGTGYSSLAYLKRLPVQSLKIDSAFVQGMLQDEHDEIIVHSTIQLAHNLGLKVVAEGVESEDIYRRLSELGCDSAQGYYIARPMDGQNAESWLRKGSWAGV